MYYYIEQWVNGLIKPPLTELGLPQRFYLRYGLLDGLSKLVCVLSAFWGVEKSKLVFRGLAWDPIPSWLPLQAEPPETGIVFATFCLLLSLLSRPGWRPFPSFFGSVSPTSLPFCWYQRGVEQVTPISLMLSPASCCSQIFTCPPWAPFPAPSRSLHLVSLKKVLKSQM
jgi:hypothetical protein